MRKNIKTKIKVSVPEKPINSMTTRVDEIISVGGPRDKATDF